MGHISDNDGTLHVLSSQYGPEFGITISAGICWYLYMMLCIILEYKYTAFFILKKKNLDECHVKLGKNLMAHH